MSADANVPSLANTAPGNPPAPPSSSSTWEGWWKYLIAPVVTALVAFVTSFVTMHSQVSTLQERLTQLEMQMDKKADANTSNINREEIANLRNQVNAVLQGHNVGAGKFETLLATHSNEINSFRQELGDQCKTISSLRERVASMEAVSSQKGTKKD